MSRYNQKQKNWHKKRTIGHTECPFCGCYECPIVVYCGQYFAALVAHCPQCGARTEPVKPSSNDPSQPLGEWLNHEEARLSKRQRKRLRRAP